MRWDDLPKEVYEILKREKEKNRGRIVEFGFKELWAIYTSKYKEDDRKRSIPYVSFYTKIKKNLESSSPLFQKTNNGKITLKEFKNDDRLESISVIDSLKRSVEKYNAETRSTFFEKIKNLSPMNKGPHAGDGLEFALKAILESLNFENVKHTGGVGDGGVDIEAERTDEFGNKWKYFIQAKMWAASISRSAINKMVKDLYFRIGNFKDSNKNVGLIITTGKVSSKARKLSKDNNANISVIDGEQLFQLCVDNNIGIESQSVVLNDSSTIEIYRIDDEWFEALQEAVASEE